MVFSRVIWGAEEDVWKWCKLMLRAIAQKQAEAVLSRYWWKSKAEVKGGVRKGDSSNSF